MNKDLETPEPDDEKLAPDVGADFDAEDEALWALLGVMEDSPPSRDFVSQTIARVQREKGSGAFGRRVSLAWWASGAAVAAALFGAIVFLGNGDSAPQAPKPGEAGVVARGEDISDVVDLLANLKESELLALEADDAEAVQDEYLGG
jgi:hypothetical protein